MLIVDNVGIWQRWRHSNDVGGSLAGCFVSVCHRERDTHGRRTEREHLQKMLGCLWPRGINCVYQNKLLYTDSSVPLPKHK